MNGTATLAEQVRKPTKEQLRHLRNLAQNAVMTAVTQAGLNFEQLEQVSATGDQLKGTIVQKVIELAQVRAFEDEEAGVDKQYGYPPEYTGPKPISVQVDLLRQALIKTGASGVGFQNREYQKQVESGEIKAPHGAEGPFVIVNPFNDKNYHGNVELVLKAIAETNPKFTNYRHGQLGPKYLRLVKQTESLLRKASEEQGHPYLLIVWDQLGLRHQGRSPRRASVMIRGNEYGLEVVGGGSILLTHPERFTRWQDLVMDLPGNEYDYNAAGEWSGVPCFDHDDGELYFGARWSGRAGSRCGSAAGFLPQ